MIQLILETDDYHEFVEVNHDGFLKMRDHQWNTYFLDHQGKRVVIDEDEYVYKGRKIIRSGYDKYALVDAETGKELVPVGTYELIHEFNEFDLARVEKGYDRRGMIDLDGNEVVPCQYKRLEPLPEIGYIAFEDKNSLWGLMDQEGKIVLKAQYDGIKPFSSEVMLIELDDRYGFLDKHFNEVIPPKYERINDVQNTEVLVELELNGKKKILNKSLKTLFTDKDFDSIRGNHYFKHLLHVRKGNLHGLFDTQGQEIIPVKYASVSQEWVDYFKVTTEEGKQGIYTIKGEMMIPAAYNRLYFDKPFFVYFMDKKDKGVIDLTGKKINLGEYEDAFSVSGSLLAVKEDKGLWGVIDLNKQVVLPFEYVEIKPFSDDKILAMKVRDHAQWSLIDMQGNVIMPAGFNLVNVGDLPEPLRAFKLGENDLFGMIDAQTGEIVFQPKYDGVIYTFDYQNQTYMTVIGADGRAGLLNLTQRKEILPLEFGDLAMLENGLFKAYKDGKWMIYNQEGKKRFERDFGGVDVHDYYLLEEVESNIIGDFPDLIKTYDREKIHQVVKNNYRLAHAYNIVFTGPMYTLSGYELFFGKPVDQLDTEGIVLKILESDIDENDKMKQITERMDTLEKQKVIVPIVEDGVE